MEKISIVCVVICRLLFFLSHLWCFSVLNAGRFESFRWKLLINERDLHFGKTNFCA